ncbi:MAG: type III-B CRISPR module-associated Cmr3 family protein, partial [Candidatus Electrothrix sp.]
MSDEPNNRTAYLFDPKSPLVFRTGRPFDQAGDPVSLDFPLPSTLAGACRTAIGDADNMDFSKDGHTLKKIPVHGPLAAQIMKDGPAQPLFPKPADAVYMRQDNDDKKGEDTQEDKVKTNILQLRPQLDLVDQDTWSDLPETLTPVGLPA